MEKTRLLILLLVLALAFTLFVACRKENGDTPCTECVDTNGDGRCDACTKEMEIPCDHLDTNGDGFCDICRELASDYLPLSIADARNAKKGDLVLVEGVVARITYAEGSNRTPAGVMLVDASGSIYVYGKDIAQNVAIGNKIKVAGEKDYWILEDEVANAEKFGYLGCNQITSAILIKNYNGNHEFDKSSVAETTVKRMMDTPITEDVTTKIFKVTALIRKAPGSGFTNYYIDDLDGVSGTYVYTQCNGTDFTWLDEFDGKICTVYLTALNAKSTNAGCNWRFLPVAVIDESFSFNVDDTAKFVVDYHGIPALLPSYMTGAKVELPTSVSSELLGFENATVGYTSSDSGVIAITTVDGVTYMTAVGEGTATVTVTGAHGTKTHSEAFTIKVEKAAELDGLTVAEAIAAANNTEVTVRGIIGPSLVNKVGFYLIDETGAIAIQCANTELNGLSIGDEIVLKGTKNVTKDGGGQINIENAEVLANYYGEHDYSTASFLTGKTMEEIKALSDTPESTTLVYVITAKVAKTSTQSGSYTNVQWFVGDVLLYTGNAGQYSWLEAFCEEGTTEATLTVELAICDWNAKGLKGCVLAVVHEDGTKTYNTLNFN